jgi:hypothetical protein
VVGFLAPGVRLWCSPCTVEQKLLALVGTHAGGGVPQSSVAASHGGGPHSPVSEFVTSPSGHGGGVAAVQPVWAGLLRPMPWLRSHS